MILVSKIYNAAMGRARMAEADRKYFFLYVDEFQNFITDTFADILSEARKYKLALIMAHQFIAQLDSNAGNNIGEGKSKVKDAVFGNVGTMMSFKVGMLLSQSKKLSGISVASIVVCTSCLMRP